jgi:predicted nucleotidyltransferase
VSPQGALQAVNDFVQAGIVNATPAGRALMIELNREHLAAQPILALVGLRNRLVERLEGELARWPNLAGAWLFGSAARGDGDHSSDIDLLLVGERDANEEWESACVGLAARVEAWTGNRTQLVEHTRRSFAGLVRKHNPLIAALRTDGIPLTPGSPALLRGAA